MKQLMDWLSQAFWPKLLIAANGVDLRVTWWVLRVRF